MLDDFVNLVQTRFPRSFWILPVIVIFVLTAAGGYALSQYLHHQEQLHRLVYKAIENPRAVIAEAEAGLQAKDGDLQAYQTVVAGALHSGDPALVEAGFNSMARLAASGLIPETISRTIAAEAPILILRVVSGLDSNKVLVLDEYKILGFNVIEDDRNVVPGLDRIKCFNLVPRDAESGSASSDLSKAELKVSLSDVTTGTVSCSGLKQLFSSGEGSNKLEKKLNASFKVSESQSGRLGLIVINIGVK